MGLPVCIGSMITLTLGRVTTEILSGNLERKKGNVLGLAFGEDEKVRWGDR